MGKYIAKRFLYMLLTLFCITAITFFLMHTIPGDPLSTAARRLPEETRQNYLVKYGLDRPVIEQFGIYLKNIVTEGDFGESLKFPGRKATETILKGSAVSASIGSIAVVFGVVTGILLGIIAAVNRNRLPDYLIMFVAILGVTVPVFVLGSLIQYFFSVKIRAFPTTGWGSWENMVMPTLTLSIGCVAGYARYMRSSVLETINQDYILTARAKGVSEFGILRKHVLRNSLLPCITMIGPEVVSIFTGAFVTEKIFGVPGLGYYFVSSINDRDYTMIIANTIFYAILFVSVQLIVDIVYGFVDPRIRVGGEAR